MKRYAIVIMIIFTVSMAFADTASIDGSLDLNAQASVNVGFLYDPTTMHRYTFGFTQDNSLSWNGSNGDLRDSVLLLNTARGIYDSSRFVGTVDVNFYWILRTTSTINAYIYMSGPMVDVNTADTLDMKLTFDARRDQNLLKDLVLDAKYGIENGSLIYSKPAGNEFEVLMDYVPVKIETYSIARDQTEHVFSSSIGVNIVIN